MIRMVSSSRIEEEGKRDVDRSIKRMLGRPYQKHDETDFYLWTSAIAKFEELVNLRLAIMNKFKVKRESLEVDGWKWNKNGW